VGKLDSQLAGWSHLEDIQTMHMLYDSESFAVVHITAIEAAHEAVVDRTGDASPAASDAAASKPVAAPQMPRHGFEIVDKRSGKEVYLDGSWAELFQQQIQAWQTHTPTQEEVEDTLEGYATLAQNPVVVH
jgi:hypothetical protein